MGAAYLLAVLGGNASPSAADISAIISSVGIDADKEKLDMVISELSGKNVEELIAEYLRSLLPCLPVAELPPLPQLLLAVVALLPKHLRRRRRKNPLRSHMTTWDSASSIKNSLVLLPLAFLPKG